MREKKLKQILKNTFGYENFRFEQSGIINSILDGKDTLAIMPTGGGKSLCYQVPALYLEGVTLVISPLISLMNDQVMNLKEYGVESAFLNSSLSFQESREIKERISRKEVKIVYVSPEGILGPALLDFFSKIEISLIAIDEAHCVSQWGHEFRKDYVRLGELKNFFPQVPMVALTATADKKTREDIIGQLRMKEPNRFISSFDRPNIKYMILERHDEIKQLDNFIKNYHGEDTGIVYCLSRDKVEKVSSALNKLGHHSVPYHAGLSVSQRNRAQELFNTEEKIIVVATIAFGMGIDRPDVRFVAHLDLPKSIESYYQETGRAGRDGKASTAWMIYGLQDVVKLSQMLETTDADESYKKVARGKLDSMLGLCESANCRRNYLLSYFDESSNEKCDYCDCCLEPPALWDATLDAQKVLSTIFRTGQVFATGHIVDVIRGSKVAKVLEKRHDQLSVYGIGKENSKEHWNSVVRQLLNQNYIRIKDWDYRSLALTQKAEEILKSKIKLELRKQSARAENVKSAKREDTERTLANNYGQDELFEALRSLRTEIAKENKIPPYIVFSDKTLYDMCAIRPRNHEEFLLVNGVGAQKLESYGEIFLEVIKKF